MEGHDSNEVKDSKEIKDVDNANGTSLIFEDPDIVKKFFELKSKIQYRSSDKFMMLLLSMLDRKIVIKERQEQHKLPTFQLDNNYPSSSEDESSVNPANLLALECEIKEELESCSDNEEYQREFDMGREIADQCDQSGSANDDVEFVNEVAARVRYSFVFPANALRNCYRCGEGFFDMPAQLRKHFEESHPGEKPFMCKVCTATFKKFSALKEHLRHHAEDPFKCGLCSKLLASQETLLIHVSTVHSEEREKERETIYGCEICKTRYKHKRSYTRHMKTHEQAALKCDVCGKYMANSNVLNTHKKYVHEKVCRFSCDLCGKQFGRRDHYRTHLQIHEKVNGKCDYCNTILANKSMLRKHLAICQMKKAFDITKKEPISEDVPEICGT